MILKRVPKRLDLKNIHLPYTLKVFGVTEEMFDEWVDEKTRADLIDGVMIVHSPTSVWHDDLGGFVRGLMRLYAEVKGQGKVLGPDSLVHLASCRRFGPDGFFVRGGRVRGRKLEQFEGTPDLMLEILSPSNRREDLNDKVPAYQEAEVGEILVIDPDEERVIVHRKRRRRYVIEIVKKGRVTSEVLEGFWLNVSWLWSDPLPIQLECLREILGEL
jgi:Uma2 family endonuclease